MNVFADVSREQNILYYVIRHLSRLFLKKIKIFILRFAKRQQASLVIFYFIAKLLIATLSYYLFIVA